MDVDTKINCYAKVNCQFICFVFLISSAHLTQSHFYRLSLKILFNETCVMNINYCFSYLNQLYLPIEYLSNFGFLNIFPTNSVLQLLFCSSFSFLRCHYIYMCVCGGVINTHLQRWLVTKFRNIKIRIYKSIDHKQGILKNKTIVLRRYTYLPTPLLRQDMAQGQFLSGL